MCEIHRRTPRVHHTVHPAHTNGYDRIKCQVCFVVAAGDTRGFCLENIELTLAMPFNVVMQKPGKTIRHKIWAGEASYINGDRVSQTTLINGFNSFLNDSPFFFPPNSLKPALVQGGCGLTGQIGSGCEILRPSSHIGATDPWTVSVRQAQPHRSLPMTLLPSYSI